MQSCHALKANYLRNGLKTVTSEDIPYNGFEGLCPNSSGLEPFWMCWDKKMRLKSAIFAGLLATTAFGGAMAHAQDSSSEYWVNPAFTSVSRGEAALARTLSPTPGPVEVLPLGFTLTGYAGVVGQLELGRVSLESGSTSNDLLSFAYPGANLDALDQAVGEANIRWNITPQVAFSTSFSRDIADPTVSDGIPVFEDTIAGGITYTITPRFAVSARGAVTVPTDENQSEGLAIAGDQAQVGAAYSFMPNFTGSVNYTYQSYDGQEGQLRQDESTLSLSLTGTF